MNYCRIPINILKIIFVHPRGRKENYREYDVAYDVHVEWELLVYQGNVIKGTWKNVERGADVNTLASTGNHPL